MMKREEGFTLVEVVASLVIIGIVLLSVAQLMIKSNDAAAINNEKLVAIDLADAVLQRLKAESYVVKEAKGESDNFDIDLPDHFLIDLKTYSLKGQSYTIVKLSAQQYYEIRAFATACPNSDSNLNIHMANVHVEAKRVDAHIDGDQLLSIKYLPGKSQIEGYVEL